MVQAVLFTKDGKSLAEAEGTPTPRGQGLRPPERTGGHELPGAQGRGAVAGSEPRRKTPGGRLQRCRGLCLEPAGKEACDHLKGHSLAVTSVSPSPPTASTWRPPASTRRCRSGMSQPGSRTARTRSWRPRSAVVACGTTALRIGGPARRDVPLRAGRRRPRRRSVQNRMDDKAAPAYRKDRSTGHRHAPGLPLAPRPGSRQMVYPVGLRRRQRQHGESVHIRRAEAGAMDTLGGHSDWVYALAASRTESGSPRPAATAASSSGTSPTAVCWPRSCSFRRARTIG